MSDSYVCSTARLKCSMGMSPSMLTVLPMRTVLLTGKPMANITDHKPLVNIAPFGLCRSLANPTVAAATSAAMGVLTPMPCIPNTQAPWMPGKPDLLVQGAPALLKSCVCPCLWAGIISITTDGQTPTPPPDLSKTSKLRETELEMSNKLDPDSVLDGIQLALDVAGFVPGFGAVPDLLNAGISALRGDFMGAGLCVLAAVPIIGDSTKAAVMVKKGLKSAKAVSKVGNLTKITDKVRRSELLTKEAANFVRVDVSKQQLIKSGLSEADADFFMKKVRGYRRKEIVKIYAESPNVNKFNIDSHVTAHDVNYPIEIGEYPKGTRFFQHINNYEKGGLGAPGNYVALKSQTASSLGVSNKGKVYDKNGNVINKWVKEEHFVELTKSTKYIKSVAKGKLDTWSDIKNPVMTKGGGIQVFVQDKSNLKIVK